MATVDEQRLAVHQAIAVTLLIAHYQRVRFGATAAAFLVGVAGLGLVYAGAPVAAHSALAMGLFIALSVALRAHRLVRRYSTARRVNFVNLVRGYEKD